MQAVMSFQHLQSTTILSRTFETQFDLDIQNSISTR